METNQLLHLLIGGAIVITIAAIPAYFLLLKKLDFITSENDALKSEIVNLRSEETALTKEIHQSRLEKTQLRIELERTRSALTECQAGK